MTFHDSIRVLRQSRITQQGVSQWEGETANPNLHAQAAGLPCVKADLALHNQAAAARRRRGWTHGHVISVRVPPPVGWPLELAACRREVRLAGGKGNGGISWPGMPVERKMKLEQEHNRCCGAGKRSQQSCPASTQVHTSELTLRSRTAAVAATCSWLVCTAVRNDLSCTSCCTSGSEGSTACAGCGSRCCLSLCRPSQHQAAADAPR